MKRWLWLMYFPWVAWGDPGGVDDVRSRAWELSPDEIVARALADNPDLAAARWGIREARARLVQAGSLASPELESEVRPNVAGREGSFSVGINQRLPLSGRLRAGRAVSRAELAAIEAEVRDAERRVAEQVRLLAVQCQAWAAQRDLKARQIQNSKDLAAAALRAAAAGEGTPAAATQFDLEARQFELDRLRIEAELQAALAELRTWLGQPPGSEISVAGPLPPTSQPAADVAIAESARPDLQAALARSDAAHEGVALARANRWADVGVGIFGEIERQEDRPLGLETERLVGLRLNVPLPVWGRFRGQIEEASASAARSEQEASALSNRIRRETSVARIRMLTAARQASEMESQLLPVARELEKRFLESYQRGETSLADGLRARDRRLALESAAVEARRDYHLARIRFESAAGLWSLPRTPDVGPVQTSKPTERRRRRRRSAGGPRSQSARGLAWLLLFLCAGWLHAPTRAAEAAAAGTASVPSSPVVVLDEATVQNLRLETVVAQRSTFEETVFALGRIRVAPGHRSVVSSRIEGRAVRVPAHIDTRVEAGQELLEVESRMPGDPPPRVVLRAPMSGLIASVQIAPGQPVSPEHSLIEIVDLAEVHAVAAVPEHRVGRLKQGNRARLRVAALPDREFQAELAHFGAEVDTATGTLEAAFHVDNTDFALRPGMRSEFSIVVHSRSNVLAIPREAIQGDVGNRSVFVRDPERAHAYRRVSVIVGPENDRQVEILGGLKEGDQVVARGAYSLAFAGKEGTSLKAALDAAHGHAHNEDGSEKAEAEDHDHDHDHGHDHDTDPDHDHDHSVASEVQKSGGFWSGRAGTTFFAATTVLLAVLLFLSERRTRILLRSGDRGLERSKRSEGPRPNSNPGSDHA